MTFPVFHRGHSHQFSECDVETLRRRKTRLQRDRGDLDLIILEEQARTLYPLFHQVIHRASSCLILERSCKVALAQEYIRSSLGDSYALILRLTNLELKSL